MSQEIRAIYEHGQFRPLEPVSLAEQDVLSLVISQAPSQNAVALARQKELLKTALESAAKLPLEGPDDGFSGADHDLALYGWKK